MNFANRIAMSLVRNLGKTVILFLSIFILGCVISVAVSIRHAIESTDATLRMDLPPIVSIRPDIAAEENYERVTGRQPNIEPLTIDTLKEVARSQYVRTYDFSATAPLFSSTLKRYTFSENFFLQEGAVRRESFWLKGVLNEGLLDAEVGVVDMVSGRSFTRSEVENLRYVAIISQEIAGLNNLGVGSSFTLESIEWNHDVYTDWSQEENQGAAEGMTHEDGIVFQQAYDFEVIGIFSVSAELNMGDEETNAYFTKALKNRIYVPNTVIIEMARIKNEQAREINLYRGSNLSDDTLVHFDNIFVLYSFDEVDSFRESAAEILPEFYFVQDASASFALIVTSMEIFSDLAVIIMWFTIGIVVIVVSLLIALFLRSRKKELGIYLALGEKRSKVILQIVVEILSVALIAVSLSLFVGNLFAGAISEDMLRHNMLASQDARSDVFFGALDKMGVVNQGTEIDEMLARFDVSLGTQAAFTFFALSALAVTAVTIVPMLYIVRLSPKKILM